MREVIQRVAKHDVARLIHHYLAARQQLPIRRPEKIVIRLGQGLACLLDVRVVHVHERFHARLLVLTLPRRRREVQFVLLDDQRDPRDRKSTRLNSSHGYISYAVFCLKKKKKKKKRLNWTQRSQILY